MTQITFWYEFASTYSYLSTERITKLAENADVTVNWQPFLLGPIFGEQGWNTSPFNIYKAKGAYMWDDMARQAEKYGLPPLQRHADFPQNGLLAARIALCGANDGWRPDFSRAVYRAQFAQARSIADENVLREILAQLDVDPEKTLAQAKTNQAIKDHLRRSTQAAQSAGIFGAPSFTTEDGSLFWGNDRLEDAIAYAKAG